MQQTHTSPQATLDNWLSIFESELEFTLHNLFSIHNIFSVQEFWHELVKHSPDLRTLDFIWKIICLDSVRLQFYFEMKSVKRVEIKSKETVLLRFCSQSKIQFNNLFKFFLFLVVGFLWPIDFINDEVFLAFFLCRWMHLFTKCHWKWYRIFMSMHSKCDVTAESELTKKDRQDSARRMYKMKLCKPVSLYVGQFEKYYILSLKKNGEHS